VSGAADDKPDALLLDGMFSAQIAAELALRVPPPKETIDKLSIIVISH
jgi:hypothetical protein